MKKVLVVLALLVGLLVGGCSGMCITNQNLVYEPTPTSMRQTANYEPGWFRFSEFEYRYMASDVMVAQVWQAQGGWVWVVWVEWDGMYLREQVYQGVSWNAEGAMKYAEKRMWGSYWM